MTRIVGALFLLLFCPSSGAVPESQSSVSVLVLDSEGQPLPGVPLSMARIARSELAEDIGLKAISDVKGRAELGPLQVGAYELRAALAGFVPTLVGPFPIGSHTRGTIKLVLNVSWDPGYATVP